MTWQRQTSESVEREDESEANGGGSCWMVNGEELKHCKAWKCTLDYRLK